MTEGVSGTARRRKYIGTRREEQTEVRGQRKLHGEVHFIVCTERAVTGLIRMIRKLR